MANKILKMCIKQGEELNREFTIKAGDNPMDLSNLNISFQVKNAPLEKARSIMNKLITLDSDINEVGKITSAEEGKFIVHFTKQDTSHPIGEYALVISLQSPHYDDIISADCCNNAKFYICEQ